MSDDGRTRETKFHLWGWIFFVICALLFIASSIRNHDVLALVASFLFLVGCVIFMIPLVTTLRNRTDKTSE
jgi:predicted membrane channel-forming protein YqfA (hemolysin III family)